LNGTVQNLIRDKQRTANTGFALVGGQCE
jgi:hypothetical protein